MFNVHVYLISSLQVTQLIECFLITNMFHSEETGPSRGVLGTGRGYCLFLNYLSWPSKTLVWWFILPLLWRYKINFFQKRRKYSIQKLFIFTSFFIFLITFLHRIKLHISCGTITLTYCNVKLSIPK